MILDTIYKKLERQSEMGYITLGIFSNGMLVFPILNEEGSCSFMETMKIEGSRDNFEGYVDWFNLG